MSNTNTGNRYMVYDDTNKIIVEQGLSSRRKARSLKRLIDAQAREANQGRSTPSCIKVFTDVDHPRGEGIYLH